MQMRVISDLETIPESTTQLINFYIEILDCKVESFTMFEEQLPFTQFRYGEQAALKFEEFH